MLISAWLNISTDHIVGTDQKDKIFWSRIRNYCVEFNSDIKRRAVACKKRWNKINKAVTKFVGCYDQASRSIRSGLNADDMKELAYKLYSTHYETSLADELGVDSLVCPQGSKKSKQKSKKKAQMSEDLSEKKLSVVKKLSFMEDIKNVREKELMDREKEREEEREHRAKIMAMKEKKLQIQAKMKEQELQTQAAMKEQKLQTQRYIKEIEINAKERKMERITKEREREMDMQILNADTSTMSEKCTGRVTPVLSEADQRTLRRLSRAERGKGIVGEEEFEEEYHEMEGDPSNPGGGVNNNPQQRRLQTDAIPILSQGQGHSMVGILSKGQHQQLG
ncbi:glutathione S-transferase T3-like [Arachis duranensis]|uniref:Glutathione S-transferase T3-like n=1 Tax=Arachis duranensis TaxID=130453 RepID=A0A6P4CRJ3_ARADU|nr:glutathione S-transferase T3-like [Arachis duranensis]